MRLNLNRFWPGRIVGQIVILVIAVALLFQFVSLGFFTMLRVSASPRERGAVAVVDRFAEFVQVLDQLPATARPQVLEAMRAIDPNLEIAFLERAHASRIVETLAVDSAAEWRSLVGRLRRLLSSDLRLLQIHDSAADQLASSELSLRKIGVLLRDGSAVTAALPLVGRPRGQIRPMIFITLTGALIITMLTAFLWWAARALTAPLARVANAAEEFSLDSDAAPLPENKGPHEVRAVSRALNRMQGRVRSMVENRTQMLAAVSHDLRTPITRMRLRAEFIDQEEARSHVLRDLDQMDRMLHGALSYLRHGATNDRGASLDIASLLQTICNDFSDLGHQVDYEGPDHLLVRGSSDELQRAVTNLVDNALKHGRSHARIRLEASSETEITIDVIDAGPGIPDDMKDAMCEPFARGDSARTMIEGSSGFGLGLAIATASVEGHGGKLFLLDAQPTGLIARLQLPIRLRKGFSSKRPLSVGA